MSEGLANALTVINVALEEGASASIRRSAVRTVQRALRKLTESDLLWDALVMRAVSSVDAPQQDDAIVEAVRDLLASELATVLVASGYRTPPPPPAHKLIEETCEHVGHYEPGRHPAAYVGSVRAALREFVGELDRHVHSTNNSILSRVLVSARSITAKAILLCAASSVEVKTGEVFDFDIGVSMRDAVQAEVTLPWSPAVVCAVIALGAATAVGKAVAQARQEQHQVDRAMIEEAARDSTTRGQPVDSAG